MRIVTVSLNPAIDQTVSVDHFQVNMVNRGNSIHLQPGGKGVNVAIFLADYIRLAGGALPDGVRVTATGFLGRENAMIFEQLFEQKGIADRCIRIPGFTRTGVKIVDAACQQTTDINLPGLAPDPAAVDQLLETIQALAPACDWFVLTGSLPPGLPPDFYARLTLLVRRENRQVVLDTSGAALRLGVQAQPAVMKPNLLELEELTGRRLEDEVSLVSAARELLAGGVGMVVISLGQAGALFATSAGALMAAPPVARVKSTVGAGDALVAGLLCGKMCGLDLPGCARLATAFSVSTVMSEKRELPGLDTLRQLAEQVTIRTL